MTQDRMSAAVGCVDVGAELEVIAASANGGADNVEGIYALSPLQEGLLFHRLLDGRAADPYVLSTLLKLRSSSCIGALTRALQRVIERHDALRTAIAWEGLARPVQIVHRRVELPVETIVVDPRCEVLEQLIARMKPSGRHLDLRRAPLLTLQLAEDPRTTERYALLQVHHLICDHQSLRAIVAEAFAFLSGREAELPEAVSYRRFLEQRSTDVRSAASERFFRHKLNGIDEPTAAYGLVELHASDANIVEARARLDANLASSIRSIGRKVGVSPARVFHAAWAMTLAHTSGRDDVVFGTVLSSQRHRKLRGSRMLGMAVNTLPLRVTLRDCSARQLIEQTHAGLSELIENADAPLSLAQRCSGIPGNAPLFSTLLNYRHNPPDATAATFADIEVVRRGEAWTHYPITLIVDDLGDHFTLLCQTDERIEPAAPIAFLQQALRSLVAALDAAPETPALQLDVLPDPERRKVLSFGRQRESYAEQPPLHTLFESRVRRAPSAVALSHEGQSWTYAQINERSNQLARFLIERGVRADDLVGLCIERGPEMVMGILGILKAGGAYLPLDPNYPPDRLAYMIADAMPRTVLSTGSTRSKLPDHGDAAIDLDEHRAHIERYSSEDLPQGQVNVQPGHLAYVIYTSGSTGKPKGVMIEHRHVTRLFSATAQVFRFDEQDVWTLFHSFAFDFSVWELWGALLHGGRLVIVPYDTARSAKQFYQLVCEQGVTVLNQTPSAFSQLIDAQTHSALNHTLRLVIFGGEALELHTLRPWVERNGAEYPQLVNMYGITETTVHVTRREPLTAAQVMSERTSGIGGPLPDLSMYVLDALGRPVGVGVVGELYVGGAGVARGYLHKRTLTATRFPADPFAIDPSRRMYRTGDIARWRPDGTLEYLGRNDQQVKIRGFRIELGEIEARLMQYPTIKEAAVLVREDQPGSKRLVAYVVPAAADLASKDRLGTDRLRAFLSQMLPEHAVPSAFVVMDALPLTSNGKLDRRALPEPSEQLERRRYDAPQGSLEEMLSQTWARLLNVARVGRDDNFFELGGDSLLAMQAMARLESAHSLDAPVRLLFECPTIRLLASRLEQIRRAALVEGMLAGGVEAEDLMEQVATLPQAEVQALLRKLSMEAGR